MTQRLVNKRALVTAPATASAWPAAMARGAEVGATDINQTPPSLAAGRRVEGLASARVLDVGHGGASLRPGDRARLDAPTAPATSTPATSSNASESDWDFAMDLNAKSMHRTIRAFLPAMLERGGGSIINMSSAASSVRACQPLRLRRVQTAVIGLTKAVAADFVARGIRCNAICPGTIESPSLRDASPRRRQAGTDDATVRAAFVARQPIGRVGRAESRGAGGLPGQRRIRLHHRHHPGHRRRLVRRRRVSPDFPHQTSRTIFLPYPSVIPYPPFPIQEPMKLVRYASPARKNPASSTPRARCATGPAWSPTSAAPRWRLNRWPASPRWMRPRCRALTASRATAARWPASARSSAWAKKQTAPAPARFSSVAAPAEADGGQLRGARVEKRAGHPGGWPPARRTLAELAHRIDRSVSDLPHGRDAAAPGLCRSTRTTATPSRSRCSSWRTASSAAERWSAWCCRCASWPAVRAVSQHLAVPGRPRGRHRPGRKPERWSSRPEGGG